MTLSVPTRNQIAAQVDAILAREPDARCIAIQSPAPDAWPDTLPLRNRAFSVRWCESPLAAAPIPLRDGIGRTRWFSSPD